MGLVVAGEEVEDFWRDLGRRWRVGFESVDEGSMLAGIGIVCLEGCVEGDVAVFLLVAEEVGEVLADCGLAGEGSEGGAFGLGCRRRGPARGRLGFAGRLRVGLEEWLSVFGKRGGLGFVFSVGFWRGSGYGRLSCGG